MLLLGEIVGLHTRWCQPRDTDWVQGRRELYLYIYIYIHGSFIHYSFLSCLSCCFVKAKKANRSTHSMWEEDYMEKGGGTRVSIDLPHHSVWMFIVTSFNRAPILLRPVNIVVPFVYFPRRPRVISLYNQKIRIDIFYMSSIHTCNYYFSFVHQPILIDALIYFVNQQISFFYRIYFFFVLYTHDSRKECVCVTRFV